MWPNSSSTAPVRAAGDASSGAWPARAMSAGCASLNELLSLRTAGDEGMVDMHRHGVIGHGGTWVRTRYRHPRTVGVNTLRQAWGLAVALSSLPWLGAAGGWLLDKVFDTFPLLLVMGGLAGVCLGLVCAYLATGTALSGGRLDPGHRPGSHSYPR